MRLLKEEDENSKLVKLLAEIDFKVQLETEIERKRLINHHRASLMEKLQKMSNEQST